MDQAPPRTLLEQLVRASRRTIDETCAAFEQAADDHGEKATLSPRQLWRWMAGEVDNARPVAQRVAALHWGYPFEVLVGPLQPGTQLALRRVCATPFDEPMSNGAEPLSLSVADQVEHLRHGVHDVISTGGVSGAGLDEWDETVSRHGQATRYRPARLLLGELAADFAELRRLLGQRHTSTALRRLTRVTAQMAGLMFLTLIELNVPLAARSWARTARVAADEAGDPAVRSWVLAQEAFVHYYAGNLAEALTAAHRAQLAAGAAACAGVPLAAALEARVLAALGRGREARSSLDRAEKAVGVLDTVALRPSAFGYNEAQPRFHEGNALTHLRDTRGAWAAQDRALDLYPSSDYLDRTLVQLDRASCLAYDGDVASAMTRATHALSGLRDEQRSGLILLRARQVLDSLDDRQRALPAARDLQELVVPRAGPEGNRPPC
ncbi:MAG TPA: XRE family transcriptional regulator [Micromonosporaceae bacterium]|nr:XRE family transcriptional regulator [Micromonosporaceae bacterium]